MRKGDIMSTTTADGLPRHREWLERQLNRWNGTDIMTAYAGTSDPTYIIRMGNATLRIIDTVADAIGDNHGASVRFGHGIWRGTVERDAEITVQATPDVIDAVIGAIARDFPGELFLHVERHDVPTAYVDLSDWRTS